MKRIYLVRHGESQANAERRHGGAETPLTEHGHQQAVFIAERISKLPVQKIISSTMVRAQQTAQAISEKINQPILSSDLFVETRGPAEFEGASYDDPKTLEAFHTLGINYGKPGFQLDGAEVFEDHTKRAQACLAFLAEQEEDHIVVVTHGLFLRILVAHVLLGPTPNSKEVQSIMSALKTRNTGLTVFDYGDTPFVDIPSEHPWNMFVWNDHAHLG
ncbi:hypothetical protein A2419_01660 [Candidatus Adlerbacteria bacterium RIFOXYC1_FULL_48_26]|uniref:Phosphoglycerate mutase n=1 Tax=Candidatus Adlerbacteria bacterium RIFOXYC1_FULL_48_26 TaxID=1797247 RepID=A0A1F4Y3D7_9BACT|nr:MAG: hypothetical protein A2419_01660 [Candidatus Adlerbacteria bacterium RIFOXYC1_FULL_48_26]OGC93415.1 MAG: hypothetical protein A2389_02615 [Candidatus Adlerbacteria bacterium RIFOXYB1_FULL_48_10]